MFWGKNFPKLSGLFICLFSGVMLWAEPEVRMPGMSAAEYQQFVLDVAKRELISELEEEQDLGRGGIRHLIETTENAFSQGTFFELVGLLHAKLSLNQEIEGAGLQIVLENPARVIINYKNQPYELHSSEFDVITQDFVIECKSACDTSHVKLQQFVKEAAMIDWLGQIRDEWNDKNFRKGISLEGGRVFLIIQGFCTGGREVKLFSSWTNRNIAKRKYLYDWYNLISNLAEKKVIVFFENGVFSEEYQDKLAFAGVKYQDRIDLAHDLLGEEEQAHGDDALSIEMEGYYNTAETCKSPRGQRDEKLCFGNFLNGMRYEYVSLFMACLLLGLGV